MHKGAVENVTLVCSQQLTKTFVFYLGNHSSVSGLDLCICTYKADNRMMRENRFCRCVHLLCLLNSTSAWTDYN